MSYIKQRRKITVKGIVQGVGFRPAIAKEASLRGLTGTVANTRDSVEIEIQGTESSVKGYVDDFHSFLPPNALIAFFMEEEIDPINEEDSFAIIESRENGPTRFSIPPDIAMCDQCRAEFNDPGNRRYRYPFITCGNCGPRYTYMKDMPYDRVKTTMSEFSFCEKCAAEYNDPSDRRYHIEGFSCPVCGPSVSGIDEVVDALLSGKVAAIKGLGGYHIACSAVDYNAVALLRKRKRRPGKPFALMFRSVDAARQYADVSPEEGCLLESKVSPIVIVRLKEGSGIAENVAPDNGYLGIMIAYTPLHQLILDRVNIPLVMTSANISGDPLIIDDKKAREELAGIVDVFLVHNREILKRADDSISRVYKGEEISIRMGRGRMPFPIKLPEPSVKNILSVGAELKSNVSVATEDNLVTSNHIGDLETPETFTHFCETVDEMLGYYDVKAEVVVADLHPDYESTAFAVEYSEKKNLKLLRVQHHYAHFLSCYYENMVKGEAAGIIFDGTGYGTDGTVWGGEIITGDLYSFERRGHLSHFSLPGGERAIREPWRILSGLLERDKFDEACSWVDKSLRDNIYAISGNRSFSPLTSSAGRLFDAAGALLGFKRDVTYEAEAAIYLEKLALGSETDDFIDIPVPEENGVYVIDSQFLINEIFKLKQKGAGLSDIAKVFHNSLAEAGAALAFGICREKGINVVLLSGGVFQNRIMLEQTEKRLASQGLAVLINKKIPANDAGISAGQAIYGVYNA
ncbi:MAG TPA: carbamoyltransferase HypF [Spirochaetota bacterium]|nr:carbamoyltransferase HypF [Spirochaetota bacterium]